MASESARKWWKRLLIAVVALAAWIFVPDQVSQWKLRHHYLDHLFIVQHDYVYKVTIHPDDERVISLYLVKSASNQFDIWAPGDTVNRVVAAAFMPDGDGMCITSRYATEPWKNAFDESAIKGLISNQMSLALSRITVSGMTVRLTVQSASQAAISAGHEIEYFVVKEDMDRIPRSNQVRYIARVNGTAPFPIEAIDPGVSYLGDREHGKPLYALAYPNIDLSSGLPFKIGVIKLSVERYDAEAESTTFEKSSTWLPEGTPVFDRSLNLLGMYTSVNTNGQTNCISTLREYLPP
jgi:hypothetical protein